MDPDLQTPNAARLPAPERRGAPREVLQLAYPVILTQISVTLMQLVDSAMVGRIGSSELGAVGFGGIWIWTCLSLFVGLATSVQTFVAQEDGAGRVDACGAWAWHGFYTVVPVSALAGLAIYFGAPLLIAAIDPSEALGALATDYMQARSFGSAGLIAAMVLISFFRGFGDTRTPLYCTVAAVLVNGLLDYALIFGNFGLPQWGVYGAGFATSVAEYFQLACLLFFFTRRTVRRRYDTRPRRPQASASRRLLRTGLPIGGQWCLEMTSFAAFSSIVARMGDASMAASQALIVLLSLSFMQAIAISIAVATLVGRYVGANDFKAAERSFRTGLGLALVLGGLFAALFLAIPGPLIGIFTKDVDVLALTAPLLLMAAAFQIVDAFGIVADGALRGAGDTLWPFVVRFLLAWGVQVPLAWFLGITLGGGLTWMWIGSTIYVALLASILVARFRSGAWKRIRI
ncbi:MAG: MATE family efflux transporter [Myxococcota bacterium]|jgi:MATE family multidrug resistance protein